MTDIDTRRIVKVLIRVAARPTQDYPFAVVVSVDGKEYQETLCRSTRDCTLVSNGALVGIHATDWNARTEVVWSTQIKEA